MNVIDTLIGRINNRLQETKTPCKVYANQAAAEKATAKIAAQVQAMHNTNQPAHYVVFYVPALGKWTGAIDINEITRRPEAEGGYVGYAASKGFFTY